MAKEREAEGEKIWEERLRRQRRREACQALGTRRGACYADHIEKDI